MEVTVACIFHLLRGAMWLYQVYAQPCRKWNPLRGGRLWRLMTVYCRCMTSSVILHEAFQVFASDEAGGLKFCSSASFIIIRN